MRWQNPFEYFNYKSDIKSLNAREQEEFALKFCSRAVSSHNVYMDAIRQYMNKLKIEQLEKDKAIMYNEILEQQKIISNLNSKRKSDRIISLEEF